jgi:hypothetical protein
MKLLLAIGTLLLITMQSYAHDFYFAFANVEYNTSNRQLEVSIEMSGHDIENTLKTAGFTFKKHIEDETSNASFKKDFQVYLAERFIIKNNSKLINLKLIGYEVLPNDLLYVYLESEPIEITKDFSFQFDLLMKEFPDQQNKLTFQNGTEKSTLVFLPSNYIQTLTIKP